MMATRWARFARGWVAAGFSTLMAALSHTLGGGATPGTLAVVLSLAFAGIVCIGLSGRALALWRVIVSVLASQLIFHGLFSLGGLGGSAATDASARAGAHDHSAFAGFAQSVPVAPAVEVSAGHTDAMWFAHLAAAAVTIAFLCYGERAFWGLLESAGLVIRRLFGPVRIILSPWAPRRLATTARIFVPDVWVRLSAMWHRGPPVAARAA